MPVKRSRQTGPGKALTNWKEEIQEKSIKKMKETHRVMFPEDQNQVMGY